MNRPRKTTKRFATTKEFAVFATKIASRKSRYLTRTKHSAEWVANGAAAKAVEKWRTKKAAGETLDSPESYCNRVTYLEALSHRRDMARLRERVAYIGDPEVLCALAEPTSETETTPNKVEEIIACFKNESQEVQTLFKLLFVGLTVKEVSEAMGITPARVSSLKFYQFNKHREKIYEIHKNN